MRISFRAKLLIIVGAAAVAFIAVITSSALIGVRQMRSLDDLEGRIVPRLEVGPKLKLQFDRLQQTYQDAVAAEDESALTQAASLKDELIRLIKSSDRAIDPALAASLRLAVEEYTAVSTDVSRRLIVGETGEELVEDMANVQSAHARVVGLIKEATHFDRAELAEGFAQIREAKQSADRLRLIIGALGLVLVLAISLWFSRGVLRAVASISEGFARFARGHFTAPISVDTNDELGAVAQHANEMAGTLRRQGHQRDRSDWIKEGLSGLQRELRGELTPNEVAVRSLEFLVERVSAVGGAFYVMTSDERLRLFAHYGLSLQTDDGAPATLPTDDFRLGDGLVGRAALDDRTLVVDDVPNDYLTVRSGLGAAPPRSVVLIPLSHQERSIGVVELATLTSCTAESRELLEAVRESLAIAFDVARSREALNDLLRETQRQATQLASQEEELRTSNRELRAQQEELRRANEELESQRQMLGKQNAELEETRESLQKKAEELAKVSSYKSQFLANMSHELRTPLNSMLLLSHLISENEGGNLTEKQIEHAKTIHGAGKDLLDLINQILDLAKIEAGRQDVTLATVRVVDVVRSLERVYEPLATEKGLRFNTEVDPGAPAEIVTDRQRLERILTNLIGNAIKFTEHGEVSLRVEQPAHDVRPGSTRLSPDTAIAFAVSDTGIGISHDALERVFQPFEQLESHSRRRYAGTGLGLAIARESAALLGGHLQLEKSTANQGSTFVCYLPIVSHQSGHAQDDRADARPEKAVDEPVDENRAQAQLLVVEDDPVLVEQLVDIIHERGLKALVARTGREALQLAGTVRPRGIILDVKLPDIDGWEVMAELKRDPRTKAIPVHFVSAVDAAERGLSLGAIGYLSKPVTRLDLIDVVRALTPAPTGARRRMLVVEDDMADGKSIVALMESDGMAAEHVTTASAALASLESNAYGCMILDLGLPDLDGLGLLERLRARVDIDPPCVVVHTGRALTKAETRQLEAYAQAVIIKDGNSAQRLREELRLFVGHVGATSPVGTPSNGAATGGGKRLDGKKVLVVDDDMRTAYALSALLSGKGATVLVADTGREALHLLSENADVHGVLMDIMMPEMDGYEALRHLRKDERFAHLPVVALTARAMRGERERCIEAGASDYLTKPVESRLLLETLDKWIGGNGVVES